MTRNVNLAHFAEARPVVGVAVDGVLTARSVNSHLLAHILLVFEAENERTRIASVDSVAFPGECCEAAENAAIRGLDQRERGRNEVASAVKSPAVETVRARPIQKPLSDHFEPAQDL